MELYHLVVAVDGHQEGHFSCSNVLCDFLYPVIVVPLEVGGIGVSLTAKVAIGSGY